MQPPSCLFSGNAAFIEDLYERYLADPEAVDAGWRDYFASLQTDPGAADVARDAALAMLPKRRVQTK